MGIKRKFYIFLLVFVVATTSWSYYQKTTHERQIKLIQGVYETAQNAEKQGNFYQAHNSYSALC